MKILLPLLTVAVAILPACQKDDSPAVSPLPQFARIHFLHKYIAENVTDLVVHRFELHVGQWIMKDSARTDAQGFVQFSYPINTEYQLRVVSDIYVKPIFHMIPSRNSGLLTLVGETDCRAQYMGSIDNINKFRVHLY